MSTTVIVQLLLASVSFLGCNGHRPLPPPAHGTENYSLKMPGAQFHKGDGHVCTAFKLDNEDAKYIKNFEVTEASKNAHQLIVHGCTEVPPEAKNPYWNCANHRICSGPRGGLVFFAWANNSTNINLPSSVGFQIGGKQEKYPIQYLVVQVHYAKSHKPEEIDHSTVNMEITTHQPQFLAKILTVSGSPMIPPHQERVNTDVCCPAPVTSTFNIIAAGVHTHSLGTEISAYKYSPKTGKTTEIITTNPQKTQAYIPTAQPITIDNGDLILARCTYNSLTRDKTTYHGTNEEDELCNVHVMYYTTAAVPALQTCGYVCGGQTAAFPSVLLPPNPVIEVEAFRGTHYKTPLRVLNQIIDDGTQPKDSVMSENKWRDEAITSDFMLPCLKDLQ